MEIKSDKVGVLDNNYILIQKVGSGGTSSVYIGYKIKDETKKIHAIKIINPKKNDPKYFKIEVEMLKKIDHQNVVKLIDGGEGKMEKSDGRSKFVYYIVLEYIQHGELFDFVYFPQCGFGEDFARLIFLSILDGLDAIHKAGVVHRDLKTENIMVSSDYEIKIADFGFASIKEGKDGMGLLHSWLGTPNYAAPELHSKTPYFGVCNDIFALAVTLFVLVTGSMPFKLAVIHDSHYSFIARNDYAGYWNKRGIRLSNSFIDLFNNLVAYDYTQRPSIDEIRQHPWVKETNFELRGKLLEEFQARNLIVKETRRKKELLKMQAKVNTNVGFPKAYKCGDIDSHQKTTDRVLPFYIDTGNHYVVQFDNERDPNNLLNYLENFFEERKAKIKYVKDRYGLKVKLPSEDQDDLSEVNENELITIEKLKLSVEIKVTNEDKLIIEFIKKSGDRLRLYNIYQEFLNSSAE